jgi:IMP dehydrogenase
MAKVRDILARKGGALHTIDAGATVLEAARAMNAHGIGGLVVREGGAPAGIFTERDILRRVVGEERDPATTVVRDVMTSPVLTCTPETSLEECAALMTARRLRHLPVVGADGLAGMVTIGDVMAFQVFEQQTTIEDLNRYIYALR